MTSCGIDKYDELPPRIGLMDIDAMRAKLNRLQRKEEILKESKRKIKEKLDSKVKEEVGVDEE